MTNCTSILLLLLLTLTPLACLAQGSTDGNAFVTGKGFSVESPTESPNGEIGKIRIQAPTGPKQFQPNIESTRSLDNSRQKKNAPGSGIEELCPKSERLARQRAVYDVKAFLTKAPLGTWELFLHKFRQQYSTCPSFIKRAYLNAARDVLLPQRKSMFQR